MDREPVRVQRETSVPPEIWKGEGLRRCAAPPPAFHGSRLCAFSTRALSVWRDGADSRTGAAAPLCLPLGRRTVPGPVATCSRHGSVQKGEYMRCRQGASGIRHWALPSPTPMRGETVAPGWGDGRVSSQRPLPPRVHPVGVPVAVVDVLCHAHVPPAKQEIVSHGSGAFGLLAHFTSRRPGGMK